MDKPVDKAPGMTRVSVDPAKIGHRIADIGPGRVEHNVLEHNWPAVEAPRVGALVSIGTHGLGLDRYEFFRCVTCSTEYPLLPQGVSCNGRVVADCPFCSDPAPASNPPLCSFIPGGPGTYGERCRADATVWLYGPDGEPNPGGGYLCEPHARQICREYLAGLGDAAAEQLARHLAAAYPFEITLPVDERYGRFGLQFTTFYRTFFCRAERWGEGEEATIGALLQPVRNPYTLALLLEALGFDETVEPEPDVDLLQEHQDFEGCRD